MSRCFRLLINISGLLASLWLCAGLAQAQVHSYNYDALGRAQSVVSSNGTGKEVVNYGFDANGNIISYSVTAGVDTDGDGVLDGQDAFPNDPAASIDSDGDGHPDRWNATATATQIAASLLRLDQFPNDPARWIQLSVQSKSLVMGTYAGGVSTYQLKINGIGPFSYSSSNAAVATVDVNGSISLIGLGQATITVTDGGSGSQVTVIVKGVDAAKSSAVVVTTVAGTGHPGSADGSALSAGFNGITGLALDGAGNLFISEANKVRQLDAIGNVTTVAGTGVAGVGDGPGVSAQFGYIKDICADPAGAMYVAEWKNSTIRKIDTNGNVTSLNKGYNYTFQNGSLLNAGIMHPKSCIIDAAGNILFTDDYSHIRKIDNIGNVSSIAGASIAMQGKLFPLSGYADGPVHEARFSTVADLAVDAAGNIYAADYNMVRKIGVNGNVTTLAGEASTSVYKDGPGTLASFGVISVIAVDPLGNIYVGEGKRVRKVDPSGYVTTVATPSNYTIKGMAIDAAGNIFVSDTYSIYKLTLTGNYTPVVTPPASVTVLSTSATGLSATSPAIHGFLTAAMASDTEDGSVTNIVNDAPVTFPVGSTTVTFTATDSGGAVGTGTAVVTIQLDSDGDGIPDIRDAFPFDPAASIDSDGDGYPDAWNANATAAQIAASTLTLDAFPNDATQWNVANVAQAYNLIGGWNLISFPMDLGTTGLTDFLTAVPAATSVWSFVNGGWQSFIVGTPAFLNSLKLLEAGKGYWVQLPLGVTKTVTLSGLPMSVTPNLVAASGWNLIGVTTPVTDMPGFITSTGAASVWAFSNGQWQSFVAGTPVFLNSLQQMDIGIGYYVNMK